ncbi:hypothetical protein EIP86_004720 [Pleurotus ostreatoroseus]|nr:hypothetical protein EIP86_004720 [Pleurotus ostreatoroseus]
MSIDFWPQTPNQPPPSLGDRIAALVLFIIALIIIVPVSVVTTYFAIMRTWRYFTTPASPSYRRRHIPSSWRGISPAMLEFRVPTLSSSNSITTIDDAWTIDLEREAGFPEQVAGTLCEDSGSVKWMRRSVEIMEHIEEEAERHRAPSPTQSAVRAHKRHASYPI